MRWADEGILRWSLARWGFFSTTRHPEGMNGESPFSPGAGPAVRERVEKPVTPPRIGVKIGGCIVNN